MESVSSSLEACSCDTPNPPLTAVLEQLIEMQRKYWDFIVEWGKANCSQAINEAAAAELALRKTGAKSGV